MLSFCLQLKKECDTVLIDRHKELLQVECENYLRDDKREGIHSLTMQPEIDVCFLDLSRMYKLLSRIEEGIQPMLDVLQNYVVQTGFEAIKSIPVKESKVITYSIFTCC